MKTQVAPTSLDAFHSTPVSELSRREQHVMSLFAYESTALTRKQIADRLPNMELSSVCGRVNSLMEKHTLVHRGEIRDKRTGKLRELVGLPVGPQQGLFS